MKAWQYYGIQSNIMVVAALAANNPFSKGVFLFLAILMLINMWFLRHD